jgi:hypothetical protein
MRKFLKVFLIILLACLSVYYGYFRKNSTLWFSDTGFAIHQPESVTQIIIRNSDQTITLIKIQNNWKVDSIEAKQDLVDFLLKISGQLEIVSPVSINQRDSISDKLKWGTSITYFSGQRKLSSMIFCKFNNDIYAIHNRSKTPYRIAAKGYPQIDLSKIFNPDRQLWMTNVLFKFRPDDVQFVQLVYPGKPQLDLEIEREASGRYEITNDFYEYQGESADVDLLNEYLGFFINIKYYPVKEGKALIENTLLSKGYFFSLILMDKNDTLAELQGYKKIEMKSGKDDPFEFYAISKRTGLIILKYNDFDPILAGKDYFLKK